MDRREFVALICSVLATPPVRAQLPANVRRIGGLFIASHSQSEPFTREFEEGLREHGYVNGKNVVIEYRFADNNLDRLPALARELAARNVEVILTATNPGTIAARDATSDIPIVTAIGTNMIGSGLAASFARPGGRVTGLVFDVGTDLYGKRLELLKEAAPGISRVAVFWDRLYEGSPEARRELERVAKALRLTLVWVDVSDDVDADMSAALRGRVNAFYVFGGTRMYLRRVRLGELALKHRLAAVYNLTAYAEAGGLISHGPSPLRVFRESARFVDKILKGSKPGDLPIEQPRVIEIVVNLNTAKALGLKIPQSVLLRADRVID